MNPATHFLVGWSVANAAPLERRDRTAVALAGIAPDVDGFGFLPEILTRGWEHPIRWFSEYHHALAHNLLLGIVVAGACFAAAKRRWTTAALALASFHLHLACDVLGARGPDGTIWDVPYLWPFSERWTWAWQGQWRLDSWQNMAITLALLALMFYLAWRRGYSPVGIVSERADGAFVATLRRRFPPKGPAA